MTKAQRILLGLTVNICRMVRTLHEHKKIKKKKNVKVFECTVQCAVLKNGGAFSNCGDISAAPQGPGSKLQIDLNQL